MENSAILANFPIKNLAIDDRQGKDPGIDDKAALDDRALVTRIVTGEKELFRIFVERHERAIHSMGMSFFRNADDASDFTQEVFLKAYRSLSFFEGRARFSTWLYKIAYNTAINNVKRKREYQSLVEEETIVDEDTPERSFIRETIRGAVWEAVQDLPDRYRICVDLFFFYDQSYQEIEGITGFPVNTIKSHVFRAKKLLRERLEDFTEGGAE